MVEIGGKKTEFSEMLPTAVTPGIPLVQVHWCILHNLLSLSSIEITS
jgi:hypothetical protein